MRTKTFAVDITQPLPARVRRNIGKFGLVVLAGQSVDAKFTHLFARHPHTKFVAIDPDPSQRGPLYNAVSNAPNASDLFFIQGPGAYLAGYLGALMAVRHPRSSGKLPPAVSLVGSYPKFDQNVLDPFRTGATDAVPGISVFERESHDLLDTAACRRIANHQIDLGSRVVVADSGACSAGALEAAGNRGIWAIAGDEDPSNLTREPWILASTTKNFGQAVGYAIRSYIRHTLPPGGHRDIRITSGDVPFLVTNLAIPSPIRATLERVTRQHMKHWAKLGGLK
jgi:basic membrane lipoprotein Med (substrate-binding protein (PBP1-ABC) superfamily)